MCRDLRNISFKPQGNCDYLFCRGHYQDFIGDTLGLKIALDLLEFTTIELRQLRSFIYQIDIMENKSCAHLVLEWFSLINSLQKWLNFPICNRIQLKTKSTDVRCEQ